MNPQYLAAAISFAGLAGVYRKRWWGPLLCWVASCGWCAIAVHTAQYPWAAVEGAYALSNLAIGMKWRLE